MKCLIVDDDELSRISLKYLCDKIDGVELIAVCSSAVDALKIIKEHHLDLIFLDIEMPSLSGIDLIKSMDDLPQIVIVSSKVEYAVEAFEYKELVIDYLTKPVNLPRLIKAVERVKKVHDSSQIIEIDKDFIFIKSEGRLVRIDLNELLYLETVGDYVRFKTEKASFLVHSSLKKIALKFNYKNFMKVHRSYIVNISRIENIEESSILLNGKIIPISRAHRSKVISALNPL